MLTPLRYNGRILTEPRSVAVQDLIQRLLNPNVQHRSELSDFGVLFAARRILNIQEEQQLSSDFLRQDKNARQIVYISTSSVRTCIPQFNFPSLFTKPMRSCSKEDVVPVGRQRKHVALKSWLLCERKNMRTILYDYIQDLC